MIKPNIFFIIYLYDILLKKGIRFLEENQPDPKTRI